MVTIIAKLEQVSLSYFQQINTTWADIKRFLTMFLILDTCLETLKLGKVCLFDKHLSGVVNFIYWPWLKNASARKLTTFSDMGLIK